LPPARRAGFLPPRLGLVAGFLLALRDLRSAALGLGIASPTHAGRLKSVKGWGLREGSARI